MERVRSFLGESAPVTASLGVLTFVGAGLISLLIPELQSAALALVGVGLVLLLLSVLGALPQIRAVLFARQARYGTNTTVMIVIFIAIVVVLNVIGARNNQRFDLTASAQFTLARQTVTVLKGLETPVKVTGFFQQSTPLGRASQQAAESLLREYRYHSDKLSYEFVDPDEKPAIARQYEIRDYGALVFESEGHRKQLLDIQEQAFTGAILNITGAEQLKVYFLAGHGERNAESAEDEGFQYAKEGLEADNYLVQSLDLSADPKVPEDAAVLIVAAPQKPLLPEEVNGVQQYLERGGKALVLLEPNPSQELGEVLGQWGVALRGGTVMDTLAFAQPDNGTPAVLRNQYYCDAVLCHPIVKDLDTTFFPGATALIPEVKEQDPFLVLPLFQTTAQSWLETDGEGFEDGKDLKGPLLLGLTVEGPPSPAPEGTVGDGPGGSTGNARIVVIGDSDFATNKFFYSQFNSDLFLNSVNWLAAQEKLISIRPKPPEFRRLVITQRSWAWILYSSMVFLPLAMLISGGVVWWRRR